MKQGINDGIMNNYVYMKTWVTEIIALNPLTGNTCIWEGPNIEAETLEEAEEYCQLNGLGYCKVIGQLIDELI